MLTRPLVCQGQGVITAVSGIGVNSSGGDGGPATSAWFIATVDTAGNFHLADSVNARIRKVTTDGINTVADNRMVEIARLGFDIGDGGHQRRNFCIAGLSRIRKVTRAKQ